MATSPWSWPTAYAIDGTTYIKDTDNHITSATDDLVDWINSTGSYTTTGLSQSMVDLTTAQTIAGVKTFSNTPIFSDNFTTGGTEVTATGAELNILNGVTATGAELNILNGATVTTTELNILNGATVTTTELNQLDGVTLSSDIFTPTVSSTVNIVTATPYSSHYIRVGNIITVSGNVTIDHTAGNTTTSLYLSVPISGQVNSTANGTYIYASGTNSEICGQIDTVFGTNNVKLLHYSTTSGTVNFKYTYMYRVT